MPTTTAVFGVGLVNLGPLTTTFTASPSCATNFARLVMANASDINQFIAPISCDEAAGYNDECYPSGDAASSVLSKHYNGPPSQREIFYFSPGVACPSGWTAAGSAVNAGSTASLEGVFTQDPNAGLPDNLIAVGIPAKSVFLEAMAPSETLVYCCPSGYDALVNGACNSRVGPLTQTTFCENFIPLTDVVYVTTRGTTTYSPALLSVTDRGSDSYVTSTFTVPTQELSDYAVVTEVTAVALIYQASDTTATATATSQSVSQSTSVSATVSASTSAPASTSTTGAAVPAVDRIGMMLWVSVVVMLWSGLFGGV
ncbi:hypothetical protein BX600DRAFT_551288 [Xylariales sp. PMI_506]|nr:hypothetical protein BX600DRAFT_551288 [Xylariales sp. PMI_506]